MVTVLRARGIGAEPFARLAKTARRGAGPSEDTLLWQNVLLDGTGDVGEDVVRVRSDEADGADDDHEDDSQHDGVFSDVLSPIVIPEIAKCSCHRPPFFMEQVAG